MGVGAVLISSGLVNVGGLSKRHALFEGMAQGLALDNTCVASRCCMARWVGVGLGYAEAATTLSGSSPLSWMPKAPDVLAYQDELPGKEELRHLWMRVGADLVVKNLPQLLCDVEE